MTPLMSPAAGAFPADLVAGRRYAVLGLGRNGLAVALALRAMGAAVSAWDDGEVSRVAALAEGLDVRLPAFRRPDIASSRAPDSAGFDALVASPGIAHRLPAPHPVAAAAIAAGIPVLSDAELLFQAVRATGSKARFVGITGTNGKSTTTALLAHVLAALDIPVAAGGNLGPAALALPLLPDRGIYVLEMSSYMLERLQTLRFDAACLLNLSPDHLDRHGDMAGYVAAKHHIFDRMTHADLAVVGVDDAASANLAAQLSAGSGPQVRRIAGKEGAAGTADIFVRDGRMCEPARRIDLRLDEATALPAAHNAQNVAAVVAMAVHLAGVTQNAGFARIADAVRRFPGLPHRQRRIAERGGIAFVDDSKATNADAAARALGCYKRVVWIAGGIAKSGGIEPLAPQFSAVAHALLIGRDALVLATTLAAAGVSHEIAGTLEAAVPRAARAAAALGADTVLLSPACASFDQFASFEARGERFAELVHALPGCKAGATPTRSEDAA